MTTTAARLEEEAHEVRERLDDLRREMTGLQDRLDEIGRELERQPRLRTLNTGFQLVASTEPVPPPPPAPVRVVRTVPDKPVDPVEVLARSPRGTALFGTEPDGGVMLLLRAESSRLAELADDPAVEFRSGVFTPAAPGLALVPVLVRVGPEGPENLYEAWAHDHAGGAAEALRTLAGQERLALHLYGDGCRLERTLRVDNPLRAFAREALALLAARPSGTTDAFHQARQTVYRQHPTVRSLWRALKA